MKDNLKLILANIIVLVACMFIFFETTMLGYAVMLWLAITLLLNGLFISDRLTKKTNGTNR